MYQINRQELPKLLEAIAQTKDLFLPIKRAGQVNFGLWNSEVEVDLDTLKTVKSAKDCFFPQSETLYYAGKEEGKIKITETSLQEKAFVVFGIKGCDVKGIEVLDKVFLSDPVDTFYAARREHGTVVALACGKPEETCFCNVFDVNPANPGADVTIWLTEESLYWEAKTEKGEALTEEVKACLVDADTKEVEEQKAAIEAIVKQLPYSNLDLSTFKPEDLNEIFDSPKWEELSKACLGCGTCTFVCPTCQCYDIKDFNTGSGVQRYRCWDSCMYSDFTMMAHGNNRTTQMQRYRQRFMHKLVYYPANNDGMFSCVGCGRCVNKCPAALNIVKVIKSFGGEK